MYFQEAFDHQAFGKQKIDENEEFALHKSNIPLTPLQGSAFKEKSRQILTEKVNCLGPGYEYTYDFGPTCSFFKFLCAHPRLQGIRRKLQLWVPDTIVYNDTDRPYWIYSDLEGEVCRVENFAEKDIIDKIGRNLSGNTPVGVSKKQYYDHKLGRVTGNTATVITADELKEMIRVSQKRDRDKWCLQKFIKCRGIKAFICRTVVQIGKRPYCWLITNPSAMPHGGYLTDENSNIVQVKGGKFVDETSAIIGKMLLYLERMLKINFEEFVCDFIKDEGDMWWMIDVKAFKVINNLIPNIDIFLPQSMDDDRFDPKSQKGLVEYKKLKRCEFCHVGYEWLSHELTLKMIFEMEEHLRRRGKIVSWLENKEYRHIDEATLYQNYHVCDYCFKLYTETQVLKELEQRFGRALGIPTKHEDPPPQEYELIPEVSLRVIKDDPTSRNRFYSLDKFRVLLVFSELNEINDKFQLKNSYYIEYEFLGETHKFKVKTPKDGVLGIQKLRLFYFFSNGRNSFCHFLNKNPSILVRLLLDNEEIGHTSLILKDFESPYVIKKTYYQNMGGPMLRANIGIIWDVGHKVSELKLRPFHGVYLPPSDYTTCDPLPDEWFEILPASDYLQSPSIQSLISPKSTTNTNSQQSLIKIKKRKSKHSSRLKKERIHRISSAKIISYN